jgi:hypothetical protein
VVVRGSDRDLREDCEGCGGCVDGGCDGVWSWMVEWIGWMCDGECVGGKEAGSCVGW